MDEVGQAAESNALKFKIMRLISLLGALAIVGFTALWTIETVLYGRYFITKIEAVVILLMSFVLLSYCITVFKGIKAGKFESQSILALEIGAYCFLVVTAVISLTMAVELILPKTQDWQNALDSLFIPVFLMLAAFSVSIFYTMKNRRAIPVSGYETLPSKWSPLWYIALLITLVLFLYGLTGAFAAFFIGRGMPPLAKIYIMSTLVVGAGYLAYLLNLRSHVNETKLFSRAPIYLEIFAYMTIALTLFEGLRKLPYVILNFPTHYQWTLGNNPNFLHMVRFLMPALCLSLALITIWLIRVRLRLPRDEDL